MAKWRVEVEQREVYVHEVEAEDVAQAREKAKAHESEHTRLQDEEKEALSAIQIGR